MTHPGGSTAARTRPAGVGTHDLLVRGGTLVSGSGVRRADLLVDGGRISAVHPPGTPAEAVSVVEAGGRFVLPGLIDAHVHFRTPGLTHKENWTAGSRAAVAGGVTTVFDMPNTDPPTTSPAAAAAKARMIEGHSLVDYRFHAGVDPARVDRVRDFAPDEASSVKVFLSGHHTAPDVVRDPAALERLFVGAAELDRPLLFHAEDDRVFELLDAWRGPPVSAADYEPHRPRTAGIVAVARLIELARRHGTRAHVLHVSSREEADLLAAAAAGGVPVSFEVTGHHLTFTADDTADLGSRIRLRPAIREAADRDRLWRAVLDGQVGTVGSDHAPHTVEEKGRPVPDAPPGLPGVQELFGTLWAGLARHRPDDGPAGLLPIVARVLAEQPARLFGIDGRKGHLREGADADLVLVDPATPARLEPGDVRSACGWSAYTGRTFPGTVELVLRRGERVFERSGGAGGEVRFGEPDGRWVTSAPVVARP